MLKKCGSCKEFLDSEKFHKHKKHGLQHFCIACNREIRRNLAPDLHAKRAVSMAFMHKSRQKHMPDGHLTREEMWTLYENQKGRCAITGRDFTTEKGQRPSPDRIDNSKGYVAGNVWWVWSSVNAMKSDLSLDEFKELVAIIHEGMPVLL